MGKWNENWTKIDIEWYKSELFIERLSTFKYVRDSGLWTVVSKLFYVFMC